MSGKVIRLLLLLLVSSSSSGCYVMTKSVHLLIFSPTSWRHFGASSNVPLGYRTRSLFIYPPPVLIRDRTTSIRMNILLPEKGVDSEIEFQLPINVPKLLSNSALVPSSVISYHSSSTVWNVKVPANPFLSTLIAVSTPTHPYLLLLL